jgi:hypothetical protein
MSSAIQSGTSSDQQRAREDLSNVVVDGRRSIFQYAYDVYVCAVARELGHRTTTKYLIG